MANRNISLVPGARVCFGNLDFIITMEGELVRSSTATQPLLFTSLDAIAEVPEELQLPTTDVLTPRSSQLLSLNYGRSCTTILVCECLELHHDACDTLDARGHEAPSEQPDEDILVHQAQ